MVITYNDRKSHLLQSWALSNEFLAPRTSRTNCKHHNVNFTLKTGIGWYTYSKPTGMKNEPKIREGILISGLPFPLLLSANYSQDD